MTRFGALPIAMLVVLVGCGDEESADTQAEIPAAEWQSADVVNDLLLCMSDAGLEVATGAAFGGGTERTTITAQTVVVGPKGDREATVLVPEPEEVARTASDSELANFFGEPIAERVFVTGRSPLDVSKSGQPEGAAAEIREAVGACLSSD